jgi:hypothetical protein
MIPDNELQLLRQYGLDDPLEETISQLGMNSVFDAQPDEEAVIELWNERIEAGLCAVCGRPMVKLTNETDPVLKRLRLTDGISVYSCTVGHYVILNKENSFIAFSKSDSRARMISYLIRNFDQEVHANR